MQDPVEIVFVPDFSGAAAPTFELRSLFFLGSLIENGGKAASFPVHVACIGAPPDSVRRMAARLDCRISVHEPMPPGVSKTANKLRGLEIEARGENILLLDVDMMVLGDFSEVAGLGRCLGVSPALRPRVPDHYWQKIYPALGIAEPDQRISSIFGELLDEQRGGLRTQRQNDRLTRMFPYYHSGFVYAPANCGLRGLWEQYMRAIVAMYDERDPEWPNLGRSDQAGFAVAAVLLERQGLPVARVRDELDTSWPQVYAGTLGWGDVLLLHASELFRGADRDLSVAAIIRQVEEHCRSTVTHLDAGNRYTAVLRHDEERFHAFFSRLEEELLRVYDRQVASCIS